VALRLFPVWGPGQRPALHHEIREIRPIRGFKHEFRISTSVFGFKERRQPSAKGKPVIMHNDGQIWDVLDDWVDTGINGFHPVERAVGMDLAKVKQRYSGRLCPIDNVDNKKTMSCGTPAEVEAEVRECLAIGKAGGGYILSTDHSLHDGMPYENIMAYLEAGLKYGTYTL
jgi:uroporphyrinogen-III decarboxylase